MTSTLKKNIYDRLLDISKLEDMNPESIRKLHKMKTMLDYLEAKDKNKKLSQKSICENIDISRSTLYRTRLDLGISSLNRYNIPVTTDAQRKKDEVRRDVARLYNTKSIDVNERDSLIQQTNDNKLENVVSRIREVKSTISGATAAPTKAVSRDTSNSNNKKTRTGEYGGDNLEDSSDSNSGRAKETTDAAKAATAEQEKTSYQKKAEAKVNMSTGKLNAFEPVEYDVQTLMENSLAAIPQ